MKHLIFSKLKLTLTGLFCLIVLMGCDSSGDLSKDTIAVKQTTRPNILLIVADDVGYSDLGTYGGEIKTPNLDKLAQSGVQFMNFYVAPNCSPTRSMLLSGTDNHIAGLGAMGEVIARTDQYDGVAGYEGYLNFNVAALPELLRDGGYHTYMTGKWHLGEKDDQIPAARGFEKSYSLIDGGASHFNKLGFVINQQVAQYRNGHEIVKELPEGFYSTRFYTERMIDYIDSNHGDGKPFFGYLAYTAPHWPLMAPDSSIAKYNGRYSEGYRAIHDQRLTRMKELGLISKDEYVGVKIPKKWDDLSEEEKIKEARAMEIYAAMIDDMDDYIGRLISHLDHIGELENTLIIFMSDNGAEGHDFSKFPPITKWVEICCDDSLDNMGKVNSYVWYGPGWGTVSSTPLGGFKGFPTQGGIRAPVLMVHPDISGRHINRQPLTVMDIMPTILEVTGIEHPAPQYNGREVVSMLGKSLWPMLTGNEARVHSDDYVIGRELFGRRSIQKGDWSIVSIGQPYGDGDGEWRLYNLAHDISQSNDLSKERPEILAEMISHWEQYAKDVNVIMPNSPSLY